MLFFIFYLEFEDDLVSLNDKTCCVSALPQDFAF